MKTNKKEKIQVPQSRLDELVAEVTGELEAIVKSERDALVKADGDEDDSNEPDPAAPSEASSGSETGAPVGDAPPAPPAEASPAAPMAPEASAPAAPEASAAGGEASAPPTLDELVAAYAELPPDQIDMHLQAATIAKQATGAAAGAVPGVAPEASAPAAPPAAAPPELSAPPMMGKAEGVPSAVKVAGSKGNGGMKKSEKDPEVELLKQQNELLKSENQKIQQSISELAAALAQKGPLRKSAARISDVEFEGKPGEKAAPAQVELASLKKSDVTKMLRARARDASLSKSDRALINGFCTGSVGLEKLSHLLTSAK